MDVLVKRAVYKRMFQGDSLATVNVVTIRLYRIFAKFLSSNNNAMEELKVEFS